jgi:hypothetical protein
MHYWENLNADLERLPRTSNVADRMRIIRHVSDDINLPYLATKSGNATTVGLTTGSGNCGNAAISTMFTLAKGWLTLPLSYMKQPGKRSQSWFDDEIFDQSWDKERWAKTMERWAPAFKKLDVFVEGVPLSRSEVIQKALAKKLEEGQMAFLSQWGEKEDGSMKGHATAVVKLNGRLYNINNQGWEKGERLQTLDEWMTRWELTHDDARFGAIVTSLKIPFKNSTPVGTPPEPQRPVARSRR